jgi:DNA-binding NarL/FixJ family response regulator
MSKTVLVCDDVDEIRMLLKLALSRFDDLSVIGEAADGDEAIAKAQELAPDVVLLDVGMPRKSGLEALPEIRACLPAVKVIMLTGFEAGALWAQARALGASDYIEKGTPMEEIADRIRAVSSS